MLLPVFLRAECRPPIYIQHLACQGEVGGGPSPCSTEEETGTERAGRRGKGKEKFLDEAMQAIVL